MRNLYFLASLLILLIIPSCSSVDVYADYDKRTDFTNFKTYAFYKKGIDKVEISDLDKFLAVLTNDERAVMILSYACGLSHREIGDAADLPIGTVKSIIFRSKEKIRESFDIDDHKYG